MRDDDHPGPGGSPRTWWVVGLLAFPPVVGWLVMVYIFVAALALNQMGLLVRYMAVSGLIWSYVSVPSLLHGYAVIRGRHDAEITLNAMTFGVMSTIATVSVFAIAASNGDFHLLLFPACVCHFFFGWIHGPSTCNPKQPLPPSSQYFFTESMHR